MIREDYFTIKEYALSKGYTVQYVYQIMKKEDSELKDRITTVNGKKVILKLEEDKKETNTFEEKEIKEPIEEEPKENTSNTNADIVTVLKEQVEFLKKENEEKNKQIERLQVALENSQRILNQEQQLMLLEKNAVEEEKQPQKKHKFLWFLNK